MVSVLSRVDCDILVFGSRLVSWARNHKVTVGFSLCSFISLVMPLLQAFNASDYKWTPYASMVQLELLEINNGSSTEYAVRLLYHGQERTIPYCRSSPCPLAQFSDYIREIVSSDPLTDCKVTNPKIMNEPRPAARARRARILFWVDCTRSTPWHVVFHHSSDCLRPWICGSRC